MKTILFPITTDIFIPFFFQLSKYFEKSGYKILFLTFSLREHVLLKKNGLEVYPKSVFEVHNNKTLMNIFSATELDDLLSFTIMKTGGLRKDWEERVLRIASYMEDFLDKNPIESVVIWNGEDFINKAVGILAKRRGIKIIYAENGYFSKTLQFDRLGVNVKSSITKKPFTDILSALKNENSVGKTDFTLANFDAMNSFDYLYCFLSRKLNPLYYKHFPERQGNSWFSERQLTINRSKIPIDKYTVSEKFIFIPFQVHDDTQILLNSNFFKDMESFFKFSYDAIKRNFGDEYKIIVKEHPEDFCRKSYQNLQETYPDVIWLKKFNIDELLDKASIVLVVNSSVGLQAVQRLKPVIVFGESFYSRNEIVYKIDDLSQIDTFLQEAKKGLDNNRKDNIASFIQFLKTKYFVDCGWKNFNAKGIAACGEKILSLLKES